MDSYSTSPQVRQATREEEDAFNKRLIEGRGATIGGAGMAFGGGRSQPTRDNPLGSSELNEELSRAHELTATCCKIVEELTLRLEPVLEHPRPEKEAAGNHTQPGRQSPLGERLQALGNDIEGLRNMLGRLGSRVCC